jgi:hypothetical protein
MSVRKSTTKRIKRINKYYNRLTSIKHLDLYIFLFSTIIIIFIKFIQFPSLTYNAEMFEENATNFFINAYKLNVFADLVTTDAGYLPLTQRIISIILVKAFHLVSLYPFISQIIAITFIGIASSIINLNYFRILNSSLLVRFILGISIGLISDYELNAFINFIYYGALLLFLCIIINKEALNRIQLFFVSLGSFLIMLSKGQYVVFIPIFILAALMHFRKKQYKSFIFYLCSTASGFIQLGIMFSNLNKTESNHNLALLPYFAIKTIYYFILTYRHVFMGYITKEHISLLEIAILIILFIIAFKKLIENNEKNILYIFLAGNFIAICSLFLTVVVSNSNISQKINPTASVSNTKSVIISPENIPKIVNIDTQNEKNIFSVKHFANLRSLFISNLLIFLTGTLVLLTLLPRKLHKIIFLLVLFFTSGAFGQIKAEEIYAKKAQSYSQWEIYSQLLSKKQYCIPINHYPALLKENCDYLLYKDQDSLLSDAKPVKNIILSELAPQAYKWKIQAVILINKPNQFTKASSLNLFAYNKNGEVIGTARQLSPGNYDYIYYLFDTPVTSVKQLIWKNSDGKIMMITPNLIVFGNNSSGVNSKIIYK